MFKNSSKICQCIEQPNAKSQCFVHPAKSKYIIQVNCVEGLPIEMDCLSERSELWALHFGKGKLFGMCTDNPNVERPQSDPSWVRTPVLVAVT